MVDCMVFMVDKKILENVAKNSFQFKCNDKIDFLLQIEKKFP